MRYYKFLNVLCVEDDFETLNVYKDIFSILFKEVYVARNGKEGFEVFKNNQIDLVITDQDMPVMTGLEMIREIREYDFNIPIILLTALESVDILREALELNVTSFIKKPLDKKVLISKLELISNSIIAERFLLERQRKYIEYTTYQEKLAYTKESLISKVYPDNKIQNYFDIEHIYKPRDILAGDSFLVKENFIFLVDAMGKGVSASITSTIATAFVDYLIDKYSTLEEIVEEFLFVMERFLMEEEILCATFLECKGSIRYATFSMPPILVANKELKKIISNNFGITKKTKEFEISTIECGFEKMLIYSDGLNEASFNGRLYLRELKKDFLNSNSLEELLNKMREKDVKIEDDLTILFLRRKSE